MERFSLHWFFHSRYGMFASVSYVLKEGMAANLEAIVNRMLESLLSEEGVTVSLE